MILCLQFACKKSKDDCGPRDIPNDETEIYLFGKVTNYLTGEPEEGVQMSILDQIGGSFILKWDQTSLSKSDGCFTFEHKRDVDQIDEYLQEDPALSYNSINQSIRSNDEDYLHLFTQQGNIIPVARHDYNATEEIQVYVVPSANLTIQNDSGTNEDYSFQWEFVEPNLTFSRGQNSFTSIEFSDTWKVPATTPIEILIYKNAGSPDQELIRSDTITMDWRENRVLTF